MHDRSMHKELINVMEGPGNYEEDIRSTLSRQIVKLKIRYSRFNWVVNDLIESRYR